MTAEEKQAAIEQKIKELDSKLSSLVRNQRKPRNISMRLTKKFLI